MVSRCFMVTLGHLSCSEIKPVRTMQEAFKRKQEIWVVPGLNLQISSSFIIEIYFMSNDIWLCI